MPSRRALIAGVAAAGGLPAAAAVLAALAPAAVAPAAAARAAAGPALPPRASPVVVVGAGIAGMAAALRMRQAGWPVRVLEAEARPGGRCRTLRAGDTVQEQGGPEQRVSWPDAPHLYLNPGPARIPHHHRALLGLCRELGVALEPMVNENRAAPIEVAGQSVPLRRAVADLRGTVAELAAKALDRAALDAPVSEADRAALLAMLRHFGALDADGRYRGSSRAGWAVPLAPGWATAPDPGWATAPDPGWATAPDPGDAAPRALPPLDLALLLDPGLWRVAAFAEGIDYAATMLQPVGGMDRIAAALAAALGDALLTGAEVLRLRRAEAGAVVRFRHRGTVQEATAGAVLLALPPPIVAALDSDLGWGRRAALAALPMAAAGKLGLHASRRFWEEEAAIYGGIGWTPRDPGQLWYPSHGFHAAGGVLLGSYVFGGEAGVRFAARAPAERAAAAVAAWSAPHPGFAEAVGDPVSIAWGRMPRARGAWAELPATALGAAGRRLAAPEPPYHFAGDHLSWLPGWQEGAVHSAWTALEGLARAA